MISIEKARKIMGEDADGYSDEEIQQFIDGANTLAEIFIEGILDNQEK